MEKAVSILDEKPSVLAEITDAIAKIPLDDRTPWRIKTHILDKETDEENYVVCLKQINEKLHGIQLAKFDTQKKQLELEKLNDRLSRNQGYFDKKELQIEIDLVKYELAYNAKLADDAIHTLNTYYTCFKELEKKVGTLNREQYNSALPIEWEKRIKREIGLRHFDNGSLGHDYVRVLQNMGHEVGRNSKGEIAFIPKDVKELTENEESKV